MRTIEYNLPVLFPTRAHLYQEEQKSNGCILLLHGFNQDAKTIYEDIKSVLPSNKMIVSLEAPLPVPQKRKEKWFLGFSWYIFDFNKKDFIYSPELANTLTEGYLKKLSLWDSIDTIVGFSQGGYTAPFIASSLPNINKVIGINCRFRHEEFKDNPNQLNLVAIHGSNDQMVNPNEAIESYKKIVQNVEDQKIIVVEGSGHFIDENLLKALSSQL
ncbi:MAG: hypothetical protein CL677_05880 [Bdellovibrionaceae bacterium]|nr:hypothetical protein [Pseudobdellovibrionaceae bacterium]|tara:strand:+ start:147792 stop:148436 length:645 start_codon:yes stop_codon:yes gene_type:complete